MAPAGQGHTRPCRAGSGGAAHTLASGLAEMSPPCPGPLVFKCNHTLSSRVPLTQPAPPLHVCTHGAHLEFHFLKCSLFIVCLSPLASKLLESRDLCLFCSPRHPEPQESSWPPGPSANGKFPWVLGADLRRRVERGEHGFSWAAATGAHGRSGRTRGRAQRDPPPPVRCLAHRGVGAVRVGRSWAGPPAQTPAQISSPAPALPCPALPCPQPGSRPQPRFPA